MDHIIDLLYELFRSDSVKAAIVTGLLSGFALLVKSILTPRSNIIWAISHSCLYSVPIKGEEVRRIPIRVQTIFIQNNGRKDAENVEILLNYDVEHFQFWPPADYTKKVLPDGRVIISLRKVRSGEKYSMNMLDSIGEIAGVISVKWDSGSASEVVVDPMRVYGKFTLVFIGYLMLSGFIFSVYFLVRIIQSFFL